MDDFLKDLIKEGKKELFLQKQAKEKTKAKGPSSEGPETYEIQWTPVGVSFCILRQKCTSCGGEHESFQGLYIREQSRKSHATRVRKGPWDDALISLPLTREEVLETLEACGHCLPVSILLAQALSPKPQMELF